MHTPTNKALLVKEIHLLWDNTYKEIEAKYKQELTKYPSRNKYYAKKHAIKVLQGWLISLRKESWKL